MRRLPVRNRVSLIVPVFATLAVWAIASLAVSHSLHFPAAMSFSQVRTADPPVVTAAQNSPPASRLSSDLLKKSDRHPPLPPSSPPPPHSTSSLALITADTLATAAPAPGFVGHDYSLLPYADVEALNVSALRLCRPSQKKLYCEHDHECNGPCHHINYNISYGIIDFSFSKRMIDNFYRQRAQRRKDLIEILRQRDAASGHHNGELLVVTFNIGYGYVFAQWYCSMLANKVDIDRVKRHLLVIATDESARKFASGLGFFTFDPKFLYAWTNLRISSSAAAKFATGPHSLLNLVSKFGIVTDLIDLGINTTIMDTDIVWAGNPLPVIRSECDRQGCDAIFIDDGRPFGSAVDAEIFERRNKVRDDALFRVPGPGTNSNRYPYLNTGFFRVTQSRRMAVFMHTLMHAAHLQQWKGTDQLVWNTLMYHREFSNYRWGRLPSRRFVPGGTLHLNRHLKPFPVAPELLAIHPSDAARHQDKIIKLIRIRHWYYDKKTCPAYMPCQAIPKCMPVNLEEEIFNATAKAEKQLAMGEEIVFAK